MMLVTVELRSSLYELSPRRIDPSVCSETRGTKPPNQTLCILNCISYKARTIISIEPLT